MEQLAWERTSVALNCVVEMEEAVRVPTDYVRHRSAFGKPIAEFQNTQFKLAACKTHAVVAPVLIADMMVRLLAGALDPAPAAMANSRPRAALARRTPPRPPPPAGHALRAHPTLPPTPPP